MERRFLDVLEGMREKRVEVVGDMIADVYLTGKIARISREAPVLVLEHQGENVVAGGAANVAHNIATLGGIPIPIGVVGNDEAGWGLNKILEEKGANLNGFRMARTRPTTSKTRIIAGGRATVSQQVVRIDKEDMSPLDEVTANAVSFYAVNELERADAAVLSDYGGVILTDERINKVVGACREKNIPTIADSRYGIRRFRGVCYIKQNDAELADAMGEEISDEVSLQKAAEALRTELSAKGILVTRGEKGLTLFMEGGKVLNAPVLDKSEVFDVSGAGDTCVAAFILAIAAGGFPEDAAILANIASGVAVRKQGTATVSAEELTAAAKRLL